MATVEKEAEIPVIQILNKQNYFSQALVPLPSALPLPPLAPSSLRLRTRVLALTSNNFTYAKLGDLFGWWAVHPLPARLPAPYRDDPVAYGRTNCWGYARVLESTFAGVAPGSFLFGYLPIGTLPLDIEASSSPGNVPGQIVAVNAYRQTLMPIYNRYLVFPASLGAAVDAGDPGIAYDALVRVMHLTGYLMAQFLFPADPSHSVCLTPAQADLAGATVVSFAPGSKVGLAFAHQLRRRSASKPARLIGAASASSAPFVRRTGLYDEVVRADEDPVSFLLSRHGARGSSDKVVLFDFGGRGGVAWRWAAAIRAVYPRTQVVAVGGEVSDPSSSSSSMPAAPPEGVDVFQVNADALQTQAIAKVGERAYFEGLNASWEGLRKEGFEGLRVSWGEGMEDVKRGWDKFARNEVAPDEGLVFRI
ncbi:hypothetical protein AAE478_002049 [Parahypoxylon ruwenzoriense]